MSITNLTSRTHLAFQHDGQKLKLKAKILAVYPFSSLDDQNKLLYKQGKDEDHVVITDQTIFHPQGGGQPSDKGTIRNTRGTSLEVATVRMDAIHDGQVLHFGNFVGSIFAVGDEVDQEVDKDLRLLFSRYHTAGHVLGAAVRHLLENEIEGFDELKASHFPDSAACEFQGSIDGKYIHGIQKKVDEMVAAKMPVEIAWWDEDDFRKNDLERLIPDRSLVPAGEKFRVVIIHGAEVYPCGGTHVESTDLCESTVVKKISRKAGQSRVSYILR